MRKIFVLIILTIVGLNSCKVSVSREEKKELAVLKRTLEMPVDTNMVTWRTVEEVEKLMKIKPQKVIVDFYTDWCGWCKRMDKAIYENKNVIKYINENFYAIKFDAEGKTPFKFQGQDFNFNSSYRAHEWAFKCLNGQLSYPTTLFMTENFATNFPVPGYQNLFTFESILKYIKSNSHLTMPFNEFQKNFKSEWQ